MLPRLVVAVIAIQISWDLCLWLVGFANSLGSGVADLMAAPFGGTEALDLNSILEGLTGSWTNEVNWAASAGLVAALVAIVIFAPGLLFLLVLLVASMLVSVLVGVGVLMLRNILVLACVIFAPLALVLWILPGTEKYWNFWKNNFTMLLLLFPLIMIIIYAGRIAASLAGGLGFPGMFDFLFVMVAFFAPYFIIVKAFKWGGGLLAAAGGAVSNVGNKVNAPIKGLRGDAVNRSPFMQARRARKTELDRRAVRGYAEGLTAGGVRGRVNRTMLRGLGRKASEEELAGRVVQSAETQVEKNYHEDVAAAETGLVRERQSVRARGGNHDAFLQAVADGDEEYTWIDKNGERQSIATGGRSELEKVAARTQIAKLGAETNWRYLESYHKQMEDPTSDMSDEERVAARKFFDDNVSTIMPKMPHFYTGVTAAAGSNPETIGQMHPVAVESIYGHLSDKINTPDGKTDAEKEANKLAAQKSLLTFSQNLTAAAENENIALDNGSLKAYKGFLDSEAGSNFKREINLNPKLKDGKEVPGRDGRQTREIPLLQSYDGLDLSPDIRSKFDELKQQVSPNIDSTTGHYTRSSGTPRSPLSTDAGESSPTSPSGRTYETGNIPGSERTTTITRENIQRMSDENARGWVNSQGGVSNMSNQDLTALYNVRRGELQSEAKQELTSRGMMGLSGSEVTDSVAAGVREGERSRPSTVRVDTEAGTLLVEHEPRTVTPQPGERVSPGGVITRPGQTYQPTERVQSPTEQDLINQRTFGATPPEQDIGGGEEEPKGNNAT